MTKKYRFRYKSLIIPLLTEEGSTIYDNLFSYVNLDIGTLYIYSKLKYRRKIYISFPICYSFTDTCCEDAVKSRMKEVMLKKPNVSARELIQLTGHSAGTINRHYMSLKKEILG